jgi:hypothetical protein
MAGSTAHFSADDANRVPVLEYFQSTTCVIAAKALGRNCKSLPVRGAENCMFAA